MLTKNKWIFVTNFEVMADNVIIPPTSTAVQTKLNNDKSIHLAHK